jgi:hypothetical protein
LRKASATMADEEQMERKEEATEVKRALSLSLRFAPLLRRIRL